MRGKEKIVEGNLRYKYPRTSLQFPNEFIEYLNEQIKDNQPKNHYVMDKCGFTNYKYRGTKYK
jgi:hypothetical protein